MANMLNTITVDGVTYNAADYASSQTEVVKATNDLDKDAFLQLLVAQIKYQDPLDPQENSSFVAELAQFSALEQMTNVATNLEDLSTVVNNMDTSVLVGQMSGMVGLNIDWDVSTGTFDDDGNEVTETRTGVISGVQIDDGVPTVMVQSGGTNYRLAIGDIGRIYQNENSTATDTSTSSPVNPGVYVNSSNRSALLGQLSGMVGMDLEWDQPVTGYYDENGDLIKVPMKGVVRGVNLEGEEPSLIAQVGTDTYKVSLDNVVNVYYGMEEAEEAVEEE